MRTILLLLIISVTVNYVNSTYYNCDSCTKHGYNWCVYLDQWPIENACQAGGCPYDNINAATIQECKCLQFYDCNSCLSDNSCIWCADISTCGGISTLCHNTTTC